jgi:hypothetical protein
VKAEVQVVAGRNFRLTMDVRVEGGIRKAQAIVWAKLDRTYALTKWEWKGDAQPEEKREPKALPGASDGAARPSVSQMASTPCVENAAVLVHWPINFPPSFPGSAWERTTGQALPAV